MSDIRKWFIKQHDKNYVSASKAARPTTPEKSSVAASQVKSVQADQESSVEGKPASTLLQRILVKGKILPTRDKRSWIVSPCWLKESFRKGRFVDQVPFVLKDEDYKLKYGIEPKDTVQRARASPQTFLCGYDLCLHLISTISNDTEMEATVVDGNGTKTGHIILTTVGGRNGQAKQTIRYMAERVVGQGSFGLVFQAKCLEIGETVAINKALQNKRYRSRELQTMHLLYHPKVYTS